MAKNSTPVTPNDLSEKLVGRSRRDAYGKQVRGFLRANFPRDVKNVSWVLTAEQVEAVTAWHNARKAGKPFELAAWRKARHARKPKAVTPKVES